MSVATIFTNLDQYVDELRSTKKSPTASVQKEVFEALQSMGIDERTAHKEQVAPLFEWLAREHRLHLLLNRPWPTLPLSAPLQVEPFWMELMVQEARLKQAERRRELGLPDPRDYYLQK